MERFIKSGFQDQVEVQVEGIVRAQNTEVSSSSL